MSLNFFLSRNATSPLSGGIYEFGDSKKLAEFRVYQLQKDENISTEINVAPYFKGNASYANFKYAYVLAVFSEKYRIEYDDAQNIIAAERFGFGIEININAQDIETNIQGGFGAFAAAAEMQLANIEYRYKVHGLPEGVFSDVLPSMGKMDTNKVKQFELLVNRLKKLYKDGIDNNTSEVVAIPIPIPFIPQEEGVENAASYYFAAKKVIEGLTLQEAIGECRKSKLGYNEIAIQYIYSECGVSSLNSPITEGNKKQAKQFIFE